MLILLILAVVGLIMYPPMAAVALAAFWLAVVVNRHSAVLDKEIL